MPYNIKLLPV